MIKKSDTREHTRDFLLARGFRKYPHLRKKLGNIEVFVMEHSRVDSNDNRGFYKTLF